MDVKTRSPGYSLIAKLFHWGFVLLFAYGIAKQVANIEELADEALLQFEIVFAASFLILLAIRFAYVKATQTSALPEETARWQRLAATGVHYGMYLALGGIALSGLAIGFAYKAGMTEGFLIDMLIGLHEFTVMASYLLIGVHVLAAVYHRILKDGVWRSMVPVWRD